MENTVGGREGAEDLKAKFTIETNYFKYISNYIFEKMLYT